MDEDLDFGASVWATPNESPAPGEGPTLASSFDPFSASQSLQDPSSLGDDFDDFGPSETFETNQSLDDDFGDFGDFEDTAAETDTIRAFDEEPSFSAAPVIPLAAAWEPLRLDPMPTSASLQKSINLILEAVWPDAEYQDVSTDENIRQVEGISQILVTAESRYLYNSIFHSPPALKPPNWKQSKTRRQHLIVMGIPVNLDEVMPHANGKPLPPLQINTRPMSAPPAPRSTASNPVSRTPSRAGTPRSGTPKPTRGGSQQSGLGPKPELDEEKIDTFLSVDSTSLALLPVASLETRLVELRAHTAATSALLTYLLQAREALQQDSETYNGLIAELVGEAQKIKTGKGRTPGKRGSIM